jgi:hypothetical protein
MTAVWRDVLALVVKPGTITESGIVTVTVVKTPNSPALFLTYLNGKE